MVRALSARAQRGGGGGGGRSAAPAGCATCDSTRLCIRGLCVRGARGESCNLAQIPPVGKSRTIFPYYLTGGIWADRGPATKTV